MTPDHMDGNSSTNLANGGSEGHILFIDAYDSFAENIIAVLRSTLNVQVTSIKIDSVLPTPTSEYLNRYDAVVAGPGPGHPGNPDDVGVIREVWKLDGLELLPVLGICLGFQSLCYTFGGSISRLPLPCHGQVQQIVHTGDDLFEGLDIIEATNYHSLHVTLGNKEAPILDRWPESSHKDLYSLKRDSGYGTESSSTRASSVDPEAGQYSALQALAFTENDVLMAVKHRTKPFWGLQFHPESCKSSLVCHELIRKWWHKSQQWNAQHPRNPRYKSSFPEYPGPQLATTTSGLTSSTTCGKVDPNSDLMSFMQQLTYECVSDINTLPIEYTQDLALRLLNMTEDHPRGMTACLESRKGGRYSIFSLPSSTGWRLDYWCASRTAEVEIASENDPFATTRRFQDVDVFPCINDVTITRSVKPDSTSSPFCGGFIGYLSYEIGLEKLEASKHSTEFDEAAPADLSFLWVERSVVVDHEKEVAWVQTIHRNDEQWLHQMRQKLGRPYEIKAAQEREQALQHSLRRATFTMPEEELYKSQIRECQEAMHAGESYELCLTAETQILLQRNRPISNSASSHALALYQRLRKYNPMPLASYLFLGHMKVVSASPEQFIAWSREGEINMIPMKGTVKKSSDMTYTQACEILASPKEQAENLMIVDLIRHDLHSLFGASGNVEVVRLCDVVEHETVYQLVSQIRTTIPRSVCMPSNRQSAVLKHGQRALTSTLPPGSMTGAPKKRSCEILSKLEKRRRGVYSGAIGHLDLGGAGAFSVCIRTAFCHSRPEDANEIWRIGAGGGLTVLSDEEAEWQEMKTKLNSVLEVFKPTS